MTKPIKTTRDVRDDERREKWGENVTILWIIVVVVAVVAVVRYYHLGY